MPKVEALQPPGDGTLLYEGDKLSLNFQNIEIRAVLQIVADFADLNLVASDAVTGGITLRLKDVPWDQALDIVLRTNGLDKRVQGNVLLVAPAADLADQERAALENKQEIAELAPLRTELIKVKYANAAEIVGLFSGFGWRLGRQSKRDCFRAWFRDRR